MLCGDSLKAKSSPTEANERPSAVRVVDPQDPNEKAFVLVGIICVLSCVKKSFFCLRGVRRGRKPQRKGIGGESDDIDNGNDGDNNGSNDKWDDGYNNGDNSSGDEDNNWLVSN